MEQHIGEIIKKIRIEKNLKQKDLASHSNYSKDYISKVENGQRNPSIDFLHSLSKYLMFDFVTLSNKLKLFKNYKHYYLTYEIINLIDNRNINMLEAILNNPTVKNEFNYGETLIVKDYATVLVLTNSKKDYNNSLNICLNTLNINYDEIETFTPSVNEHNYYYGLLLSLAKCLSYNKQYDILLALLNNIICFFESNYFNDIIPLSSVPHYYKKFYMIILNNYADTLFNLEEYKRSLQICNAAIEKSIGLEILGIMPPLYKLLILNLYNVGNIKTAKAKIEYFKLLCSITNNNNYYNATIRNFKKNAIELFE